MKTMHELSEIDELSTYPGGSSAATLHGIVGQSPALGRVLRLVETVARAIHVAHLQKIVHRDLKPANILLPEGWPGAAPNAECGMRNAE